MECICVAISIVAIVVLVLAIKKGAPRTKSETNTKSSPNMLHNCNDVARRMIHVQAMMLYQGYEGAVDSLVAEENLKWMVTPCLRFRHESRNDTFFVVGGGYCHNDPEDVASRISRMPNYAYQAMATEKHDILVFERSRALPEDWKQILEICNSH